MPSPHSILLLLQAAAAQSDSRIASERAVEAAFLLIVGMQGWVIRSTAKTRDSVRSIEQALFGRTGDAGIERTVQEHGGELRLMDGRMALVEDHLERMRRARGETQPRNRSHRT
jgi:hypothetical protein